MMSGARPEQPPAARPVALTSLIAIHLEKVLSSDVFRTADRLRDLLRFTVRETLEGRGGDLKEYLLGTSVLRRGDSFDPKTDPIVRTQMRRLREHLGVYYATEGRYDPVVIEIAKGTYVPTFRSAVRESAVTTQADTRAIVGREKELTTLRSAFDETATGRGQFVCLSGEPGIGKTVVLDAFLLELARSGVFHHVARGRCSERLAGSEAYLPLLEAFEYLLRRADASVAGLIKAAAPAWHAQIAPLIQDVGADTGIATPGLSQERLKRELVTLLQELARRETVVIVLDDLHWADASTIDMLAYAATRYAAQRVLIVGTYRPADLRASNHPFLALKLELQGHALLRELPMPFLTRTDVESYLSLRFPEHRFPAQLAARIHDRTEGNPLFMADLVRFLCDRGVVARRDGRWVLLGPLDEVERDLPESVRSMVERKIGQLDDGDHRLLAAASVQGYVFDSAVVARALAIDAAIVEERLDELARIHGFVTRLGERQFPDRTIALRYRFVHVLYQNALYASVQPMRKASLSAAVAAVLLDYFGEQRAAVAAELAMLFEAAREFLQAAEYFQLAAEQASCVAATTETVVLARRGLAALTMMPETIDRVHRELRLQTILGPALMISVGWGVPEVEATYLRARDLCSQIGEAPQLFPVIYGLWGYWHGRAEFETAVQLGEQLLASAQSVQDSTMLLLAHYSLANTLAVSGDWERSRTHVEQAIPLYVPQQHRSLSALYGGHDPGVVCRSGLPINLWVLGYPDQAVSRGGEGMTLAREIGHVPSVAFAFIFDAMLHQHLRDASRCRASAEAATTLTTSGDLAPLLLWATVLRGWAMVQQGMADEGITLLRQGIEGWRMMGLVFRPYFLRLLAESYGRNGQAEEALAAIAEALAVIDRTHEGYAEAELHRLNGELQRNDADAAACFHRAIAVAQRQKAKSFELRAVTSFTRRLRKQGRCEEAADRLEEVYGWFTEGFDTVDLRETAALLREAAAGRRPKENP
jgi:predicted ATPase